MVTNDDRQVPPLELPIVPFIRLRGLFILVSWNLAVLNMSSNLSNFWDNKNKNSFRHVERCIERLASFFSITNHSYCLVWFSTTLHNEAYKWYTDHPEVHFTKWN